MIRKLRRDFTMITMVSVTVVLVILVGAINIINFYQIDSRANSTIRVLSENKGKFPIIDREKLFKPNRNFDMKFTPETPFETRYFIVEVNGDGNIRQIDTSHIAITSSEAEDYATRIMHGGKETGYLGNYKYTKVKELEGYMIVFLNCRNQIETAYRFLLISGLVALGTLLLVFLLVTIFSKRAIKPIIESMEKQKQFITDAGHEIKTPIAIISVNADVLELANGKNEWIDSIRNQTNRLDKLVKNLLVLSKMEEDRIELIFKDFNLSKALTEIAKPFLLLASSQNKEMRMEVPPDIMINGNESSIHQLISTLVDNAVKYANSGGMIKITLSPVKNGVKLEVFNTTDHIQKENLDQLFDRFYRADSSRSRETGGYGIGLSIAKSIVEAHHGKIFARSEDGRSIRFTVIL